MKILLIAFGVLAILIGLMLLIGALLPKHHTSTRSAHFNAGAAQLFALVAGPQNWRPDVAKYEDVPDASGRRLQRETARRGHAITYELLNIDPPHTLERRIATPGLPFSGTWTFTFTPANEGTDVRITEDGEIYNPVFRFVSRFILGYTATIDAYLRAMGKATGQEVKPQN